VLGAGGEWHERLDYPNIMMHRPEVDLAASYMRGSDAYAEWGSGGSTRSFPPLVRQAWSIEHDCEWLEFMRRQLNASARDYGNLQTVCSLVPPTFRRWGTISSFEHGDYRIFIVYVDVIDSLGVDKFDIVLVDGRARMACAMKAIKYMHSESILLLYVWTWFCFL
jgi:hypothetical protein